jgi:hypothetical protein
MLKCLDVEHFQCVLCVHLLILVAIIRVFAACHFRFQILRLGFGASLCVGAAVRRFAAAAHSGMLPSHVPQADRYYVAQNFASRRQKVGALTCVGFTCELHLCSHYGVFC